MNTIDVKARITALKEDLDAEARNLEAAGRTADRHLMPEGRGPFLRKARRLKGIGEVVNGIAYAIQHQGAPETSMGCAVASLIDLALMEGVELRRLNAVDIEARTL